MAKIPVGVQLYSVREDCARDLPGTLEEIADMGYQGVEFAGYHGYSARELRKMLDDLGLKCCGSHIGLDQLLGDELPKTVEFHQILGNRYLVVPSLPVDRRNSSAAWVETAALFSGIAQKVKSHSMLTGYHNHHIEFEQMDGETGFDHFFGNTGAGVIMQLDIGNALHGNADPMDYLKRYLQKAVTVHLKEYSSTNDKALLGEGDVDWQEVFKLCEAPESPTEWYIVEQESYPVPPMESIRKCLNALREMGKR